MKKKVIVILAVLLIVSLFGCSQQENKKPTINNPGDSSEQKKDKMRILAIGNSFSTDCMEYLYDLYKAQGNTDVILGNLVYGGCSLQQHCSFAQSDDAVYTYKQNDAGYWQEEKNATFNQILTKEDWDIITFQQTSKTCGLKDSYDESLTKLIEIVKINCPNATLIFNMTWAYQQDSTISAFVNYNNDQMTMYNMIVECMNECIIPNGDFKKVIPVATAIQNARTSFVGDTLTRDGYHLDLLMGRYIAALCWYCSLNDTLPSKINGINPSNCLNEKQIAVANESVENALANPYTVTESAYKTIQ